MAVVFQEYSGRYLCQQHFAVDVEAKAKYEIRRHHWMMPGDHIAVALSGDHISSALLYFLKKLTLNRRDIRISAIFLDQGIAGNRDMAHAMRIAKLLDTECIKGSFREEFGITVDEIAHRKGSLLSCTYCRVLQYFLLNRIAMEHGITKFALGDTLDEGAMLVLKDILQGKPEIMVRSDWNNGGKIPRIQPFISVPRKEVAFYADLHIKGCNQSCCPYHNTPFEDDVNVMLNEFTIRHPATKYALMSLKKNLTGLCGSITELFPSCIKCGKPSEGLCENCHIINEVTSHGT